jgi:hypothetical protein
VAAVVAEHKDNPRHGGVITPAAHQLKQQQPPADIFKKLYHGYTVESHLAVVRK